MAEVVDLDVLNPAGQRGKVFMLNGHEIDVSFIPTGITFEVDEITQELQKYSMETLQKGGKEARKALELLIRLCALFCAVQYPEMDERYFKTKTSPVQVEKLATAISDTLIKTFEDMEAYQKN